MAGYIRYNNQGATRNRPLNENLIKRLGYLQDMGITMEVFSGGQPSKEEGGGRVGSVRHDHGGAADAFFYKDGRKLDWANKEDQPIFQDIVSRGKAAGITGFGAGDGYMQAGSMHIGGGKPGVWGADGKGDNAPAWLKTAYNGAAASTKIDPVAEVIAAAASPTPETPAKVEPDDRGLGTKIFDRLLGTETAEQAKAPLWKSPLPDKFMGVDTKKGINMLGALSTAMNESTESANKQIQAAAQAGAARRGAAQPVELSLLSSNPVQQQQVPGGITSLPPAQLLELLKKRGLGGIGRV